MAETKTFVTEEDGVVKVRTCAWSPPGDHPVGCGMFIHVKDGKIVKVEGDPDHPITQGRLCPRCIALDEVVYHKDRLLSPMVRKREDRGRDTWEKISWDEAYDILEEKIREIQKEYGAEAIFTLTGTGRESTLYAPVYGPAIMDTRMVRARTLSVARHATVRVLRFRTICLVLAFPRSTSLSSSRIVTTILSSKCLSTSWCGVKIRFIRARMDSLDTASSIS